MIKSLKENRIRINKGKILTREDNIKKHNPDRQIIRVKSAKVQSGQTKQKIGQHEFHNQKKKPQWDHEIGIRHKVFIYEVGVQGDVMVFIVKSSFISELQFAH